MLKYVIYRILMRAFTRCTARVFKKNILKNILFELKAEEMMMNSKSFR